MNDADNPLCYVANSPLHGRGLFAREDILPDTWIGHYDGRRTDINDTYVLWVMSGHDNDGETWIGYDGTNALRFLNHARCPNGEMDGRNLYALKGIRAGEEITIDYGDEFEADINGT